MEFNPVDIPTVTVVVQYPSIYEKGHKLYTCKVTFDNDLELALLQATFALKAKIKEEAEESLNRLNALLDDTIKELESKLESKEEEKELLNDTAL